MFSARLLALFSPKLYRFNCALRCDSSPLIMSAKDKTSEVFSYFKSQRWISCQKPLYLRENHIFANVCKNTLDFDKLDLVVSYWKIRFGRILARAPQPPLQEANFRLRPDAICCHQNLINKKVSRFATWTCQTVVVVKLSWIMAQIGDRNKRIFLRGFWFADP